jgi:predicted AAA+ superfamily ATPase
MHLREESNAGGAMLENLVLHDLAAWRDSRLERTELSYWRTASGEEVDFVVETGGHSIPIEVKATSRPRLGDTAHLRSFRAEHPKHARAGLLLHTGKTTEWIAPDVLAVPWWRIL